MHPQVQPARPSSPPVAITVANEVIHILVPVHNRRKVTERFVASLAAQTDQRYHLVLIDDGSTDGTAEMVTHSIPNTTVIRGSGAWWWAGSLQQGFDWIKSRTSGANDIVLIVNDDTEFDRGFLASGRRALARAPRSLLLAQLYSLATRELMEVGARVDWSKLDFRGVRDPDLVNCYSTRGLFLRARDFIEIGGFRPTVLPHYGSDYEFTMRARRKGFKFASDPEVRIFGDETTTGTHTISASSLPQFLRQAFSRKTVANPLLLSTFVILSCPRYLVPLNLVRVWKRFMGDLVRCAF
jgi:GT2 family glycosyltransferase